MYMYLSASLLCKEHETIVEGHNLRTAKKKFCSKHNSTAHDSTSQRNPLSIICDCHTACNKKFSKIISDPEIITDFFPEFGGLLRGPGYFLAEFWVEKTVHGNWPCIFLSQVSHFPNTNRTSR